MKLFYLFCILLSPIQGLAVNWVSIDSMHFLNVHEDSAILEVMTQIQRPNFIWVRFRGLQELSMFIETMQRMTAIRILNQKNTLEFFVRDNTRRNFIMRTFQAFDPTVPCPIIGEDSDAVMGVLVSE